MKSIVVYYSKTGNTKAVAELIADGLECAVFAINVLEKKGRGTKIERDREKALYENALQHSIDCDLAIIGTPTGFQRAKSMVQRYVRDVHADSVALFCTYDNKIGSTLKDLEETLSERGVEVFHTLCLGGLKPGSFSELEEHLRSDYIDRINDFIRVCEVRLERGN